MKELSYCYYISEAVKSPHKPMSMKKKIGIGVGAGLAAAGAGYAVYTHRHELGDYAHDIRDQIKSHFKAPEDRSRLSLRRLKLIKADKEKLWSNSLDETKRNFAKIKNKSPEQIRRFQKFISGEKEHHIEKMKELAQKIAGIQSSNNKKSLAIGSGLAATGVGLAAIRNKNKNKQR